MAEKEQKQNKVDSQNIKERPPVVAVLGHVDHGKSSLLEAVREDFAITAKESGGITQHIGAYEVVCQDKKITFIDTPGHEAFSEMRQRGAKVADIAVLVIDAKEGVKDQTKEAIQFIKKAGVPMVVAFNKIDVPGSKPEKVKQQLSKQDILVESYGGKVPSCDVSAKTGAGIKELLETILLVAEVEELKADTSVSAHGIVVESSLDHKKGPVVSLLIKEGVLRLGDFAATSSALGKIKQINDFEGKNLQQALPSQPVAVLGFETSPGVGERFKVYNSKNEASAAVLKGKMETRTGQVINIAEGVKVLNIVLKSDVLGSSEAIEGILKNVPQDKVVLRILELGVGNINVGDVKLAQSGQGLVFGFRVKPDVKAKMFALQHNIKIKIFDIIYELVQEIRKEMTKALSPETKRIDVAKFKITHLFKQDKTAQIVGGKVIDGELTQNIKAEVMRDEEVVGSGRIKGLEQDKKTVGKVEKGKQAGIMFAGDIELEENDILVVFKQEQKKGAL